MDQSAKKCVPCEGGVAKLDQGQIESGLASLDGWQQDGDKIKKMYKFKNFKDALGFVNKVGDVAEAEGHHPDIYLAYGKVEIVIWTHSIKGLSNNDFILAGKIESF